MKRPPIIKMLEHFEKEAHLWIGQGFLPEDIYRSDAFDLVWVRDTKTGTLWEVNPNEEEYICITSYLNCLEIHPDNWPTPKYDHTDNHITCLMHEVEPNMEYDMEITDEDLKSRIPELKGMKRLMHDIKEEIDTFESESTEEDTRIILGLLEIIQEIRNEDRDIRS